MSNTDFSTAYWYTSSHMVTSKRYEVHIIKRVKQIYCEIITIYDVLIFAYFMVNWNHENQTPRKKHFSIDLLLVWNHEFNHLWVNAFCRYHENWCPRI